MTRPPQGAARVARHRRKRAVPNGQKRKKVTRVRKSHRSESKVSKVGRLTQGIARSVATTSRHLGSPAHHQRLAQRRVRGFPRKLLAHAASICEEAKFGNIYRLEDDALCLVASHNTPAALAATRTRVHINPNFPFGRMVATKKAVHVADIRTEEGYVKLRDPQLVGPAEISGVRTILAVPMLKDGELIGSFTNLPATGAPVYRKADRAGHQLRRSSRRRD